jgi:RNA recognition motif-containing protein
VQVFVANFRVLSERELRDVLSEHVPIVHIEFAIDPVTGRSKGFAWVTVADTDGAIAIAKWHGLEVGGRRLRAEVAMSGGRRQGVSPPA